MANIVRMPKSGSDWTANDLNAYNILVKPLDSTQFFGVRLEEVVPSIEGIVIDFDYSTNEELVRPKEAKRLLQFLDLATRSPQESTVDTFAEKLLNAMDYDTGDRLVCTRRILPLVICGHNSRAQTDICVLKDKTSPLLLMVQEDKRLETAKDPEPQVIAEAIAAFQENNKARSDLGLDSVDSMLVPCITMVGTFPRFYLVPVDKELNASVMSGQYPINTTVVLKHTPRVPRRVSEGMKPIGSRKIILQCYEAFKIFVNELEQLLDS